MKQKSLKKNAIYNMIRNLMNIIFPIISFPYASRVLLPAGMGKVNFANSIIEYFSLIALLGIKTYASRECAKVRDDRSKLSKIAKEILAINAISTAIAYFLFFIALFAVPKFADYRILLAVCSAKILFLTMGMDWLYTANEEYRYIAIRSVFFQILSLAFLFTFIKTPDDYILYGAMGVLSSVGSNLCNIIHSRKYIDFFSKTSLELKRHLKPVFIFFGNNIAAKIHSALDSVMLGFLLTDTSVGYYAAANKISVLVRQLISSITYTMMPRSTYYLETNNMEKYNDMLKKAADVCFFFSLPSAFGLFFLCKPVIILFSGESYLPALNAMRIIIPTIIVCAFGGFLSDTILIPMRKEKIILYGQCTGALLNIILNAIFIPTWGVFGAAFATLLVECSVNLVYFVFSFKYIRIKTVISSLTQAFLGSSVMLAVLLAVFRKVSSPAMQTATSIICGTFVYAIIMLLLKNTTAQMIVKTVTKKFTKNKTLENQNEQN